MNFLESWELRYVVSKGFREHNSTSKFLMMINCMYILVDYGQ